MSKKWKNELFPKCFDLQYTFKETITSSFVEEQQFISTWKSKSRKIDFITSRVCAHQIFLKYYPKSKAVLKDENGVPQWGFKCIGSLSHTQGCWAAVIGVNSSYSSVGLDVEYKNRLLSKTMINRICNPIEMNWLSSLEETEQKKFALAFFSLKEALYKVLSLENQKIFSFKQWNCQFKSLKESKIEEVLIKNIDTGYTIEARVFIQGRFIFSGVWF